MSEPFESSHVPARRIGTRNPMSVTVWLIVINVAVFFLDWVILRIPRAILVSPTGHTAIAHKVINTFTGETELSPAPAGAQLLTGMPLFQAWGHFSDQFVFRQGQVWRLIGFQFLHANLTHLAGNMLGLYFFGSFIEQMIGRRRFLVFYLLCGFAGPAMHLLFEAAGILSAKPFTPLIGASAGVFGVIAAAARVAPMERIQLLFPPVEMELRWFALGVLAIAAYTVFTNGNNAGGEAAHLGGAAVGYLAITRAYWLDFLLPRGSRQMDF